MRLQVRAALLVGMMLFAVGCQDPVTDKGVVLPSGVLRVGVAFDIGGRGDKSFADSAAVGIDRARTELGVEVVEVEASVGETSKQKEQRLREMADAGLNPIIAVGFAYAEALKATAPDYPNNDFAIVDFSEHIADNVAHLVFIEEQGSFLVGVIAAQASKHNSVGFIGGVRHGNLARFEAGFIAGARAVKPGIRSTSVYLTKPPDFTGFTNPAAAEKVAAKMYRNGVDVVYHAAGGSGVGLFRAARAAKRLAIGVDSDQYLQFPPNEREWILTSMVKRLDVAVFDYIKSAAAGQPFAGVRRYGLDKGGVDYSATNPLVTPYVALAERYRKKVLSGAITPPTARARAD